MRFVSRQPRRRLVILLAPHGVVIKPPRECVGRRHAHARAGGFDRVTGRASGPGTRMSIRRPDAPIAPRRRGPRATSREPPGSAIRSHPGSPKWIAATAARVGASAGWAAI
jgi:hypothetical protein